LARNVEATGSGKPTASRELSQLYKLPDRAYCVA
jgi:hypothetical protein